MTAGQINEAVRIIQKDRELAMMEERGELSLTEADEWRADNAFDALELLNEIVYDWTHT